MRDKPLPFALPDIDEDEVREVADTLRSGWITTGPKARALEERLAAYVGAKHGIAVASCTAAMHLALEAAGVRAGDRVITTPYTFAATAEVVRYFGATPVFVDIDAASFNIDVDRLAAAIPGAKAVLAVHVGGHPCDLGAIHDLARRHGTIVIEDAAHALPTRYDGRMVGGISDFTCFSFYATKPLTTGEGGMVLTNDAEKAERCRVMSLHGISRDAWKREGNARSWYYEIITPGYKYNLSDVHAAMGLVQLDKLERMWARRAEITRRYDQAFGALGVLDLPPRDGRHQHSWHLYMLRLRLDRLAIDRDAFVEALRARRIGVSVHFVPLHLHPYYRETYGLRPEDFPIAVREFEREISLPIYSKMSDRDIDDVIDAVREIALEHRR
jgi:dTDP-4-amino-4,6-dideoxygalactose transaminase